MSVKQKQRRYKDMTLKDIDLRLRSRGMLDSLRVQLISRLKTQRKTMNKKKRADNFVRNKWEEVLIPLLKEHESVRVRIAQIKNGTRKVNRDTPTRTHTQAAEYQEQHLALWEAYIDVLKKVRDYLRFQQKMCNDTPVKAMLAKRPELHKMKQNNNSLPIGASWVDWIEEVINQGGLPYDIQHTLLRQHAATPTTRRPLEPLFRRDDYQRKKGNHQHTVVLNRWADELNYNLTMLDRTAEDDPQHAGYIKTIALIRLAMDRVRAMPFTKRAPPRWLQMIRANDYDVLFGKDYGLSTADLPVSVLDDYEYVPDDAPEQKKPKKVNKAVNQPPEATFNIEEIIWDE